MSFSLSLLVSILFHYLWPLFCRQHCLCSRGSLETLAWQRLEKPSDVMFRDALQGLRGEISLAVPLTPGNWAIEMVLPPLTEQHNSFPSISRQRSVIQTPKIPAEVEQQGDSFIFQASLSVFSPLWWQIPPGFGCHLSPPCCLKYLKSISDREEAWWWFSLLANW